MPGEQKRINVLALVVLAALTGGTTSIGALKFSWVPDHAPAGTRQDDIRELRQALKEEADARQSADTALNDGAQKIWRELIEFREKCKYVEQRCSKLERSR